ncbi:MAG: GNAT family N-acetyltransferase [Lachnospiraceae bacterium]|nr:GNAT family N-acetyltransferase [Lachnospiraceae bacterium]
MEIELWIDINCQLEEEEQKYIESIREILPMIFISDKSGSMEFNGDTNVKKEPYAVNQKYTVYLSDDPQKIRQAKKQGYPVIAYLRDDMSLDVSPYAVKSLLALDEEYLARVYCHSKGIPQVIITTDRLIIREMAMSDLDALLEIYETNEKTAFFQAFYDNREEAAAYLADYIRNVYDFYGFGIWGICLKEDSAMADDISDAQMIDLSIWCPLIGIIGLTPRDEALELGYALAKAYQGRKYIVEAREAVIEYAKEVLGYQEIIEITQKSK